jgi:starvation-inducible DNA-binding protein
MATTADLSVALAGVLGRLEDFSRKAQTAHWNVVGPDFTEFHQLFGEIYETAYGFVDDVAESIRRIDGYTPPVTGPLGFPGPITTDALGFCRDLASANDVLLADVTAVAALAGELAEYGIQNLLGDIQFAQQKTRWMLNAHLS